MANTDLKNHKVAACLSESAAIAENNDVKPNLPRPTECPEKEEYRPTGLQPATEQEENGSSGEGEVNEDCSEDQNTEDTELLQDDVRDDTEGTSKECVETDAETHMPTRCSEQKGESNEEQKKVKKDTSNKPEVVETDEKKDASKEPVDEKKFDTVLEPVETQGSKAVATKRITQENVDEDIVSNKKLKPDSVHENAPERIVCEE